MDATLERAYRAQREAGERAGAALNNARVCLEWEIAETLGLAELVIEPDEIGSDEDGEERYAVVGRWRLRADEDWTTGDVICGCDWEWAALQVDKGVGYAPDIMGRTLDELQRAMHAAMCKFAEDDPVLWHLAVGAAEGAGEAGPMLADRLRDLADGGCEWWRKHYDILAEEYEAGGRFAYPARGGRVYFIPANPEGPGDDD